MNQNLNDPGIVVVSPDTDRPLISEKKASSWPWALAGVCLLGMGLMAFLAFTQWRSSALLQEEVSKLKQSNQTLNDENAKVKQTLDEQTQAERTKTTTLETQVINLQTQVNEWATVQGGIGGTGYRPPATPAATGTEEPAINVASMMKVFRLDMNLSKLADYPDYTADITGPAGQKPSLVKVTKAVNGVAILIASSNLTDGKYTVKLSGRKDGISKELGKPYTVNLTFPK
jgi:hypothetical protein